MTHIRISEYTKEKLEEIKNKERHTTMDSVIRRLIDVYEKIM